jgi:hypothetical protein
VSELQILEWGRTAERLLVVGFSGIALFLGWSLFRLGIVDAQSIQVSGDKWNVRFDRVAPGIFFALFGASCLAYSLYRPLSFTVNQTRTSDGGNTATVSYLGSENDLLRAHLKAINTAQETVQYCATAANLTEEHRSALTKMVDAFEQVKPLLLRRLLGDQWAWYYNLKTNGSLNQLSDQDRIKYDQIEDTATRSFHEHKR